MFADKSGGLLSVFLLGPTGIRARVWLMRRVRRNAYQSGYTNGGCIHACRSISRCPIRRAV